MFTFRARRFTRRNISHKVPKAKAPGAASRYN